VGALLPSPIQPLRPDQPLDTALEQLAQHSLPWRLPVVAEDAPPGGEAALRRFLEPATLASASG
jgi:hypothetical protein